MVFVDDRSNHFVRDNQGTLASKRILYNLMQESTRTYFFER